MFQRSVAARVFLKVLRNARFGTVKVEFPDGTAEVFGAGDPQIRVKVKAWRVFDLLFYKGDLGLADAVMADLLEVDDLTALVEWACRNDHELAQALHGTWVGTILFQMKKVMHLNNRRGARKNIMAHYDVGNDFYKLWLDRSMTYSSGIYGPDATTLEAAQLAKYDRLIDGLGIKAGDRVLEIGCGWGGFFSRAVERTGCHVTAVMNSPAQARHNRRMIADKGFAGHVELREIDYRDIEGKFDKIVSIEMIEAVGEQYWGDFFGKISASLSGKGSAMIQAITIREDLFNDYRRQTDFIQQYVFPGGMLLTNGAIATEGARRGMKLGDTFEFALSYADTLKEWRRNFHAAGAEVRSLGFDRRFVALWDLYLAYCEGAFRAGRINVGQFLLAK